MPRWEGGRAHRAGARVNGRKIQPIVLGSAVGAIEVLEGWDAPLTSDDLADWLGGSVFPSDLPE